MTKPLCLGVPALMVGAIVTIGSGVSAFDYTRPGISCREANGNIRYSAGNAENPHQQTNATFICPMHRRYPISDLPIENIRVSYDDQAFYESITCHARSCDKYGNSCSNTSEGVGAPGEQKLNLGLSDVDADPNGYVYLICDVPDVDEQNGGNSAILSYGWRD